MLLLSDHWSPILAVLAPFYWIHDGPTTLLVAQAVLFALAIPPLWTFTARQLGPRAAYGVATAYALSLPIMAAVTFDFHEVAFVPVLTAVMAERFQAGRRLPAIAAAVGLLLVKEDLGLLLAGLRRLPAGDPPALDRARLRGRRPGRDLAGQPPAHPRVRRLGHLLLGLRGVRPHAGAPPPGTSSPTRCTHCTSWSRPSVKVRTMIGLLAPLGFLPLASPLTLAAVPLLAERMLASGYPLWWQAKFQYNAFIVMIFFLAAVDGAARLQRWWRAAGLRLPGGWAPATVWAAVVFVAALGYVPLSPFGQLLHPKFYMVNARTGPPTRPPPRYRRGSRWRRPTSSARACPDVTPCCCSTARPAGRHGWSPTPRAWTSRSAPRTAGPVRVLPAGARLPSGLRRRRLRGPAPAPGRQDPRGADQPRARGQDPPQRLLLIAGRAAPDPRSPGGAGDVPGTYRPLGRFVRRGLTTSYQIVGRLIWRRLSMTATVVSVGAVAATGVSHAA